DARGARDRRDPHHHRLDRCCAAIRGRAAALGAGAGRRGRHHHYRHCAQRLPGADPVRGRGPLRRPAGRRHERHRAAGARPRPALDRLPARHPCRTAGAAIQRPLGLATAGVAGPMNVRPWMTRRFLVALVAMAILFVLLVAATLRLLSSENATTDYITEEMVWLSSQGQYEAVRFADA